MRTTIAFAVAILLTGTLYWSLAEVLAADHDRFVYAVQLSEVPKDFLQPTEPSIDAIDSVQRVREKPTFEEPDYSPMIFGPPGWNWNWVPFESFPPPLEAKPRTNRPTPEPGDHQLRERTGRLSSVG
jgi:hypothetical protein